MVTKVIGRITDTTWSLQRNCKLDKDNKYIFDAKPIIEKEVVDIGNEVICEYDAVPQSVYNTYINGENIIEIKREFHADIPEWREYVDVVVKNTDFFKEEVEKEYEQLIREYNAYVINGDEKLLAYCKLHGLVIEETDADELREFIPNQTKYNSDIINVSNSINLASISSYTVTSDNYTISC